MVKNLLLKIIRVYQNFISPSLGQDCRFYPTCSEYFYCAVEKYGLGKGFFKGVKRILKCYPWRQGGIDLP